MPRRAGPLALSIALIWPLLAQGQGQAPVPLSAIDWLNTLPPVTAEPIGQEPPVAAGATRPSITVDKLEALDRAEGLISAAVTGLPADMWRASDSASLIPLIARVPVDRSPSMRALLYTLLLSEALPPRAHSSGSATSGLLLARIDRLMTLGAVEAAQAMALQARPDSDPAAFRRWFEASLLTGDEEQSCAALNRHPHLSTDYAARIFCALRGGDWAAAALLYDAALALDLLAPGQRDVLERFLHPDMFDGAKPLPVPARPDVLTFRLFETIGEPLPTSPLPRAFAVADLRDLAGWKAQLEAAERLGRSGALSPNRLLGIYTARLPAASGGIWDRVEALQRFDTALGTRSADAVARTLPGAWAAMQQAGLEVPFATLFAEALAAQPLTDARAQALVARIRLLSPDYELAAQDLSARPPPGLPHPALLIAIAQGLPPDSPAEDARTQAIADGFSDTARPPARLQTLLQDGRLGEAILHAVTLFDSGAAGNLAALTQALATFRSIGLEDSARRAALQLLLLEPR